MARKGRPTIYYTVAKDDFKISQTRLTNLRKLSKRAYEKYIKITSDTSKSYISDNLKKYRDASFYFDNPELLSNVIKTEKGFEQFEKQLKRFTSRSWEKRKMEQYKYNILGAVEKSIGESFRNELEPIINQIKSVNEFDYIWENSNGRLDISFFYIRSAEDARKTFEEIKSLIKKYIKEYHQNIK